MKSILEKSHSRDIKKTSEGFQLSYTASDEKFLLRDTCRLHYNGDQIISAQCEPFIVMTVLPFDKCENLHSLSMSNAFWDDKPLWLSDVTAALMASFLDVISRFDNWNPFQEQIANSWKTWEFRTRVDYGANLIHRKIGSNCPKSLLKFQQDLSRQYDVISSRANETHKRFEDDDDDDDEVPF